MRRVARAGLGASWPVQLLYGWVQFQLSALLSGRSSRPAGAALGWLGSGTQAIRTRPLTGAGPALAARRANKVFRWLKWHPMDVRSRPALRAVESIIVADREHGRVIVLRDTQGISGGHAVVPAGLWPVVARFTGAMTCEGIARDASADAGVHLPVEVVVSLAADLERGLFLDGPMFRAARTRIEREFADAPLRPASHAEGAYHGDRGTQRYINRACIGRANGQGGQAHRHSPDAGRMVAVVAPHIDPWRGALGYGRAYGALADALGPDVDTFVLFGTSHAPMREPFALCRKASTRRSDRSKPTSEPSTRSRCTPTISTRTPTSSTISASIRSSFKWSSSSTC